MKTLLATALIISLLTCLCIPVTAADVVTEEMEDITANYVENQIIVLTDYYVSPEDYPAKSLFHGVPVLGIEPLFGNSTEAEIENYTLRSGSCFPYLITTLSGVDLDDAIFVLTTSSDIIAVDKNYVSILNIPDCELSDSEITYGTGYTTESWGHTNINLSTAWTAGFIGNDDLVVAVIDSSFNLSHADIDTFDSANAYNTQNQSTDVSPDNPNNLTDLNTYHGTFVSGIIGATYNNDLGINGVCQNVSILPIKIPVPNSQTQSVTDAQLLSAFSHAISKNAKVVNCSFAYNYSLTSTLSSLITNAKLLVVVAAGNNGLGTIDGVGTGHDMQYVIGCTWARTDNPYFIVVGASDSSNLKCTFSNFSKTYCDLFAPGVDIYSTNYNGFSTSYGTSFAAPYVTAACALIMSKATHLTPLQVKNYILNNVTTISALSNYCVSGGVLSIGDTVEAIFAENRGAYTKGDVNGDGYITSTDYTLCQQIYNGTYSGTATSAQLDAADINNNGSVDSRDYLLLKRYVGRTYYFIP